MKTIKQLEEALEAAHGGQNATDIEMASAELAEARATEEIRRLKSVLKIVADTLPFIGGNPRSVENLLREIKAVP